MTNFFMNIMSKLVILLEFFTCFSSITHAKNLYFFYNKSNHQIRNCYFKKKMTSDTSSILEFMQIDIDKLISDFHQVRIYADLVMIEESEAFMQSIQNKETVF